MTETQKEPTPGLPPISGTAAHRGTRMVPIHLTASPDLVDLALAYVADGSISNPETPALLRRIASEHLAAETARGVAVDGPAPPPLPVAEGFVLVDYEIRPGVRGYRLAKVPENVAWRIRIGAFERLVHRTLVLFVRRLFRFFAAQMVIAQEWKAGLVASRDRDDRSDALRHLRERTSP